MVGIDNINKVIKDLDKVFVVGDIHGMFKSFVYSLIGFKYKTFRDSVVIVAGDVGLGFYKLNHEVDDLTRMNNDLIDDNIHVVLMRGNHDNPSIYHDTPEELRNFSNVHIVDDYSVLTIRDKQILMIGGATSIDSAYRIKNVTWWKNESVDKNDNLQDILDNNNISIVITHTAPLFVSPRCEKLDFISTDTFINIYNDRKTLADVFFKLHEKHTLTKWIYGHFHEHIKTHVPKNITEEEKRYLLSGIVLDPEQEYDCETYEFICLNEIDGIKIDYIEL